MHALRSSLFAAILVFPLAVSAAGFNDDTPPDKSQTSACPEGQIWDADAKKCAAAEDSRFDDDARYDAARELAYHGQPDAALLVLASADQTDPRILNYQGFAHRKAGRTGIAMTYYRAALRIDPDYILARSYMGQALAEQGDFEAARAELLEIRNRGGRDSWAYAALKRTLQGKTGY